MTRDLREAFIYLVRLGIGHEPVPVPSEDDAAMPGITSQDSNDVDWEALKALVGKQGLTAVVLDGIGALQSSKTWTSQAAKPSERVQEFKTEMPQKLRRQWIGEVIRFYENRYQQYEKAISSLAGFYNQHGFKMMLLKGYACSLDWPKPNHRQCGDIDIWLFNQQAAADKELVSSFKLQDPGFKIDNSHHHHTVFRWQGFSVENHFDFVNVYQHKSHVGLERILKELGNFKVESSEFRVDGQLKECSDAGCKIQPVIVNGEVVYLPSPNLHALFLLKHAALHFVGTELNLRQILDWAFFLKEHGNEVDWEWLLTVVDEHGMMPFFNIVNAICVDDLGFEKNVFPTAQINPDLKQRVVDEVFASAYNSKEDPNVFIRNIKRYQRWRGNAWKHQLCFKDSMWSTFWSGVWAHLLKPASI